MMCAATSSVSVIDWGTQSASLRKELEEAKSQGKLTLMQLQRCLSIIHALEDFIDPLNNAINHSLLGRAEFHDCVERLLPQLKGDVGELWKNILFAGCGIVAYQKESEFHDTFHGSMVYSSTPVQTQYISLAVDSAIQERDLEECLTESKAEVVLKWLQSLNPDDLKSDDIQRCTKVFSRVKQYFESLNRILDCPPLKEEAFYLTLFALLGQDNQRLALKFANISTAIIQGMEDCNSRSRRGTPTSSAAASPFRLNRSADGAPSPGKLMVSASSLNMKLEDLANERAVKPKESTGTQFSQPQTRGSGGSEDSARRRTEKTDSRLPQPQTRGSGGLPVAPHVRPADQGGCTACLIL